MLDQGIGEIFSRWVKLGQQCEISLSLAYEVHGMSIVTRFPSLPSQTYISSNSAASKVVHIVMQLDQDQQARSIIIIGA